MLTYTKVKLNNSAWEVFYNTADSIHVLASDDIQERYALELRKARNYRLFSVRTKHSYQHGRLIAFAVAYGSKIDDVRRDVFISTEATDGDIAELKYRCSADGFKVGAAA